MAIRHRYLAPFLHAKFFPRNSFSLQNGKTIVAHISLSLSLTSRWPAKNIEAKGSLNRAFEGGDP